MTTAEFHLDRHWIFPRRPFVTFSVLSCTSANVLLTETPGASSSRYVQVILGKFVSGRTAIGAFFLFSRLKVDLEGFDSYACTRNKLSELAQTMHAFDIQTKRRKDLNKIYLLLLHNFRKCRQQQALCVRQRQSQRHGGNRHHRSPRL